MEKETYKVGLVENEEAYRRAFSERFNSLPSGRAVLIWNSAEEFWRDPRRRELDLLFLDIGLPHMNGVELAALVNQESPETSIVMLTNMMSEELIFKAIRNGAIGYILKSELRDFADVIQIIQSGGAIITPTIALRVMIGLKDSPSEKPDLTDREKQTLAEITTGATVGEAAKALGITENTARAHVKNIYKKLQVSSRVELMRKAIDLGLL